MTTIIEGIAERIGGISYSDLPPEAVHWAKAAILDTVGVTLAGAAEPCTQIVARVLSAGADGSEGECLIFGTARRAAPLDAALINGTAAHALDYDDVALRGHPSTVLVPAILAEAEHLGSSGADMITAYVAGYETWAVSASASSSARSSASLRYARARQERRWISQGPRSRTIFVCAAVM